MPIQKRILVAPLNWGLGHATRCIPIINALQEQGFEPVLASDGAALTLLKKEFPYLEALELPSYKITYAKNGKHFKMKILWDSPKVLRAIQRERKRIKQLIETGHIHGIISDNRLGVRSKKVPSIFITHQLNVLSGNTTWFSSKMHQRIIKKFDVCWVPDVAGKPNLTGKLGHLKKSHLNIAYLGPLSRFKKMEGSKKYDLMVLLSGPEPQRGLLAKKLLSELREYKGEILFVQGNIEAIQKVRSLTYEKASLTMYNFMHSKELEQAINASSLILCRSGYTTVMDLAKLEKKAFFIPTPGQYEQEYLAKRLEKKGLVPFAEQGTFQLKHLERVQDYKGLSLFDGTTDLGPLFRPFLA